MKVQDDINDNAYHYVDKAYKGDDADGRKWNSVESESELRYGLLGAGLESVAVRGASQPTLTWVTSFGHGSASRSVRYSPPNVSIFHPLSTTTTSSILVGIDRFYSNWNPLVLFYHDAKVLPKPKSESKSRRIDAAVKFLQEHRTYHVNWAMLIHKNNGPTTARVDY